MSDITFDQRVAIVTGAGGGLGRSYALELARRGARVVVNDLGGAIDGTGGDRRPADLVPQESRRRGGEAVANYDSVSSPEGGAAIVQTAVDAFGTVDVVINNAGILRDRSFGNLTVAELQAVMDVHLMGAFYVSLPAFPHMKEKGYGRFIFTSSNAGIFGNFGQTNYGAAKAGLVGFSSVLALEGAKYNIKSNVIAPVARTRLTEELLGPLTDFLDPDQVAPMVVYLCSEENQFTHQIFTAGGGRYGRIFIGTNEGWFSGMKVTPSVEQIRDNLDQIRDISQYEIPMSSTEEIMLIAKAMGG